MIICPQCRKLFTPERSTKKFCDDACRNANFKKIPPLTWKGSELLFKIITRMWNNADRNWGRPAAIKEIARYEDIRQHLLAQVAAGIDPPDVQAAAQAVHKANNPNAIFGPSRKREDPPPAGAVPPGTG